jgi:hypothetical protein
LAILRWSAQDPHPWVRRKSLSSEGPGNCNLAFVDTIDRILYPGVLDLVIRGAELGIVPDGYLGAWTCPSRSARRSRLTPHVANACRAPTSQLGPIGDGSNIGDDSHKPGRRQDCVSRPGPLSLGSRRAATERCRNRHDCWRSVRNRGSSPILHPPLTCGFPTMLHDLLSLHKQGNGRSLDLTQKRSQVLRRQAGQVRSLHCRSRWSTTLT